ncbi:MAG: TonB-dependent receptor, partial [Bacteroidota bacterium]
MIRFLFFFPFVAFVIGLDAQPLLDKKVRFSAANEPLESALHRLADFPQVSLAFSDEILPSNHRVTFPESTRSIRYILRQLLRKTRIKFKVIGGQIVLYYKPKVIREYIISGYIEDQETGERLIGANIFVPEQNIGTTSNAYGFYSIRLKEGTPLLTFSYLGYQKQSDTIHLRSDLVKDIALQPSLTLKEVIVTAQDTTVPALSIFSFRLSPEDMTALPSVGGENDILRYASFMPGVQTGADGVGGLYVRGGSVDQNLILLDDVTVYNPTHLIGVFSVFNPNAIKSAELIKGRFPARYGGRLSSILDIRTKDGNKKQWAGEVGVGLSSINASIEGPLIKDKSSVFISARTSPLNLLIEPISRRIKERRNQEGFMSYKFYDTNAKLNYAFSPRDNIYLSFYRGGDQFNDEGLVRYTINEVLRNEDISFQDLSWGNTIGALRWNHVWGNKLFFNTSLTYSEYDFESQGSFSHRDTLLTDNSTQLSTQLTHFSSNIRDLGVKINVDYLHSAQHTIKFGGQLINHAFTPGVASTTSDFLLSFDDLTFVGEFFDTLSNPTTEGWEYAFYLEDHIRIGKALQLNLGLRSSGFLVEGEWYHSLQPRLDAVFSLNDKMDIHGSYSYMQQFLHLLTTSGVGLPTDLWVPTTAQVKPQSSWQVVLGWGYRTSNNFVINVEAYYKRMNDIIDFLATSSLEQINSYNWENKITVGTGRAYGVEFMVEKQLGRTRGLLSYTWAKSDRQFEELNNGEPFPFRYDRRHDLKAYLIHQLGSRWSFSASFTFGTGLAVSLPTEEFAYYLPSDQLLVPLVAQVFDGKNNIR